MHQHEVGRAAGRADRLGIGRVCRQLEFAGAELRGEVLGKGYFLQRVGFGEAEASRLKEVGAFPFSLREKVARSAG